MKTPENKPKTARERIAEVLAQHPGMTATAIAVETGMDNGSAVSAHLHSMVERGQVARSRERPATFSLVPGWVPLRERAGKTAAAPTLGALARSVFGRPNSADLMAARVDAAECSAQPADDNCPPTHTAQAGVETPPAADKPGVSALNNPGSVPAELARVLSRPGSSAAGHAVRPPSPSGAVAAAPEGGPDDTAAVPVVSFLMDDQVRLTLDLGDDVLVISREDTARLYRLLYRFGDALL